MMNKDEECKPCKEMAAAQVSLGYCPDVEDEIGISCKELHRKALKGEMKPMKVFNIIRTAVKKKGSAKDLKELNDIHKMVEKD